MDVAGVEILDLELLAVLGDRLSSPPSEIALLGASEAAPY